MTRQWISRVGGILTLLFLLLGLAFLQVSIAGKGFVYTLPAYGAVGIAALACFATIRSEARPNPFCLWATAIFGGYVIVRALTSPAPYFARADLYSMLAALTLWGLTVSALSSSRRRMVLITLLLVFAMLHVLAGLAQFGLIENFMLFPILQNIEVTQRATGLYVNPDHLAGLLEVLGILGLGITCWSRWPKVARVLVGYLTVICYLGLALTGSRGGYLSVAASFLVFAVLSMIALRASGSSVLRKYGRRGVLIALAIVVILSGLLIRQSVYLGERLENVVAVDETRLDLWGAAIKQWELRPLTGTGSGTYRFYGRQFRAPRMQNDPVEVHNDYLHLLCEYGLFGFLGFGLFFSAHVRNGWKTFVHLGPDRLAAGSSPLSNRLGLNIGALSALGAYVIHSVVDFNLHIPANALLLAFVFGILANPDTRASTEAIRLPARLMPRVAVAVLGGILLLQCARLFPGEYFAARARVALENEDPTAAVTFANQALAYEQQNPKIFFYLGRGYTALGDEHLRDLKQPSYRALALYYGPALNAFDKARRLAPLEESYPLDMAFAYDQMGRFSEAEWMYIIARSRDPRSNNISNLYQAHLQTWANSSPENPLGWRNLTNSQSN